MEDVLIRITIVLGLFSSIICNEQASFRSPSVSVTPTVGQPWPAPKKMMTTSQMFGIDAYDFEFYDPKRCDLLQQAFVRYHRLIFGFDSEVLKFRSFKEKAGYLMSLSVTVTKDCSPDDYPTLESDESCKYPSA